jgi:hypothetical protein
VAGSTSKKVIVERFEREPVPGFVVYSTFATQAGVEILTPSANAAVIPLGEVKAVHFVRDFESGTVGPEQRAFVARPKSAGLWVRLVFRDGDVLEGILPNDLLQVEPLGYTVTPPDRAGNSQRIFVPRQALREIRVLGVIGSPLNEPRPKKPVREHKDQIGLFEE